MKKESSFSKMFRRDEIFRNNIVLAGFVVFIMTSIMWPIRIGGELFNKEVAFIEIKYSIKILLSNLILYIFLLFYLLKAKKKHFSSKNSIMVTSILSIYITIRVYFDIIEPFWIILIAWLLLTMLIFMAVRYLFKQMSESLLE